MYIIGAVYGQGHVSTLSGFSHRILGPGDYILLQADNTVVQGKFERNPFPTEGKTIDDTREIDKRSSYVFNFSLPKIYTINMSIMKLSYKSKVRTFFKME